MSTRSTKPRRFRKYEVRDLCAGFVRENYRRRFLRWNDLAAHVQSKTGILPSRQTIEWSLNLLKREGLVVRTTQGWAKTPGRSHA